LPSNSFFIQQEYFHGASKPFDLTCFAANSRLKLLNTLSAYLPGSGGLKCFETKTTFKNAYYRLMLSAWQFKFDSTGNRLDNDNYTIDDLVQFMEQQRLHYNALQSARTRAGRNNSYRPNAQSRRSSPYGSYNNSRGNQRRQYGNSRGSNRPPNGAPSSYGNSTQSNGSAPPSNSHNRRPPSSNGFRPRNNTSNGSSNQNGARNSFSNQSRDQHRRNNNGNRRNNDSFYAGQDQNSPRNEYNEQEAYLADDFGPANQTQDDAFHAQDNDTVPSNGDVEDQDNFFAHDSQDELPPLNDYNDYDFYAEWS
jgi:hypothetical protein